MKILRLASLCQSFVCLLILCAGVSIEHVQAQTSTPKYDSIPAATHILILQAEDERRWDRVLSSLLTDVNPVIRSRAALAAGRIGNDQALPSLSALLKDDNQDVRAMAAFAIGEIESNSGADVLISMIRNTQEPPAVRARAIEALGKIAAALPRDQEARTRELGAVILEALRGSSNETETILLGLTAALRARPTDAGSVIGGFLNHQDPRVRADAANALARLRAKDANTQLRSLLTSDPDPIVRANAARVLGATEDKSAADALLGRALNDSDSRVRVSAIRALASIKEPANAEPLLKRAGDLIGDFRRAKKPVRNPQNELLEITTTLGRLLPLQSAENKSDEKVVSGFISNMRELIEPWAPEVELAYVRVLPGQYLASFGGTNSKSAALHWRAASSVAQALGEINSLPNNTPNKDHLVRKAQLLLHDLLDNNSGNLSILKQFHPEYAVPDILRAFAVYKPRDLGELARRFLSDSDVVVRSTAADLIGDLPSSDENSVALISALSRAQNDRLNDALLSIIDALGKQKVSAANEAVKKALQSKDPLVRRRAAVLLKANNVGDFASSVGTVKTSNTKADYQRALARGEQSVQAVVTTSKGSFTMELLPRDAPLTVDNFIRLAQRGYFRGITIHRVVPNFVIQDGDPRGDGNGGPGYQIRCEINQVPYERAAVGMALSGKDTGGSQWFVTHSRQPHLDGGYTVFGTVSSGMDVVDNIVRGDVIRTIVIRQK